jgi:hypothetical protein
MSTNEILHALVVGLLAGLTFWGLQHFDFYSRASKGKRFLISLPVFVIEMLILNWIWPF